MSEILPSFTSRQWRRLKPEERAYWRARKVELRQKRAADKPLTDSPPSTPFRTKLGHPLDLHHVGNGGVCFIVLSGPSILSLDLSLLRQRGCYTLGINNSPAVFRPNFWTYVDRPQYFHSSIWRDPGIVKSVPIQHMRRYGLRSKHPARGFEPLTNADGSTMFPQNCPNVIGHVRNAYFEPERWLGEPSINWGNSLRSHRNNKQSHCLNVMFCVLKHAYSLGFRFVYLLGADFHMRPEQPYAFAQAKDAGKSGSCNRGFEQMNGMLAQLKPVFDEAEFFVFNCNPESGLLCFPHVSYRDAIKHATHDVPQDPLDTAGWY